MVQKLCSLWQSLPSAIRWMVLLSCGLAAIVFGGVVTAYGGVLLLLIMFLFCQLLQWYLLDFAGLTAVGRDAGWRSPAFRRAFLVSALVGALVLAGLIFYRQTIYVDDYSNYWAKQDLLLGAFRQNGFYGLHLLVENLLTSDYKMFSSLFITGFYLAAPKTIQFFMLSMYLGCVLPALYGLLLVCQRIASTQGVAAKASYLTACGLSVVLTPLILFPITHGMPDIHGLAFIAVLVLCCWDYRFEALPVGRLAALFLSTFCIILTRRWYMFWVLAFWFCYALQVLAHALREKALPQTLKNIVIFGLPSVIGIVVPLALTFKNILSTNYSDVYGAYYGGGALVNCGLLAQWIGGVGLIAALAGFCLLLLKKESRWQGICLVCTSLLAFLLFTRIQSFGYHQALLMVPLLVWCWAALLAWVSGRLSAAVLPVTALWMGVLFLSSLGLLPINPAVSAIPADITRRTDFDAIRQVTAFAEEHCEEGELVYVNSPEYSGNLFRFSGDASLRELFLWESSIPSTHGFSTDFWEARYVLVGPSQGSQDMVGRISAAFEGETPVSVHYQEAARFDMGDTVLICYERITPADQAECDYLLELLAPFDQSWPELFSQRMNDYLSNH